MMDIPKVTGYDFFINDSEPGVKYVRTHWNDGTITMQREQESTDKHGFISTGMTSTVDYIPYHARLIGSWRKDALDIDLD